MFLVLSSTRCMAQAPDSTRWQFRLSAGNAMVAGFGQHRATSWFSIDAIYPMSHDISLGGGFAKGGTLIPYGAPILHSSEPRSLAPRREGTDLTSVWVSASWQANDKLFLWASLRHTVGFTQQYFSTTPAPASLTAVEGGTSYAFNNSTFIELHFHIVHGNYGELLHTLYGSFWNSGMTPPLVITNGPWYF